MKKKLPNIYKGRVKNDITNQKQSIVDSEDNYIKEENNKPVSRQINDIFSSPNYVYKADVEITLNSGENIKKTIIGRTNNSLITMDDELIDVSNISQIYFLN